MLTLFLTRKELLMLEDLQLQMDKLSNICVLIENEEEYVSILNEYLPELNQTIHYILCCSQDLTNPFTINEQFVIQVLKDILYGMEHQDSVILLDAIRYGLMEIYSYGRDGLQREEIE